MKNNKKKKMTDETFFSGLIKSGCNNELDVCICIGVVVSWGSIVLHVKIDLKACTWLTDSYCRKQAWISLTYSWKFSITC